jgi:ABC-type uncharacterized transport system ATPase subunit
MIDSGAAGALIKPAQEPASARIGIDSEPDLGSSPRAAHPGLALWVENVTVSFSGFLALDDVTLTIDKGELRCIIGPNGAGKTTLMDVITGRSDGTARMARRPNRCGAQISAAHRLSGSHRRREPRAGHGRQQGGFSNALSASQRR